MPNNTAPSHQSPLAGQPISRRRFIKTALGFTAGGIAACISAPLYAYCVEPTWIEVTRLDLSLPGLPDSFNGLTIAQLSDLHCGVYVSSEMIRRSVEMTNALEPDLVLLTGDYIFRSSIFISTCAQELSALKSRKGIYAVLGNHDIWHEPDLIASQLEGVGIKVLRNDKAALSAGTSTLWLLGIDDAGFKGASYNDFVYAWQEGREFLARLQAEIPENDARILLVHNPDFNENLPEGRIDLALCGHTHGGQVRLPLIGPPIVPSHFGQKYAYGLVQSPASPVYINRGIGLINPAVRFNCRPEITLLRLLKRVD